MFNGKIDVAKGFQTSVNIAYDLNNADKVRDFIPTQSSLDIIEDVLLSTANNATDRARILVGAYGRGKSHIILVLMALLSKDDKSLFSALLLKMKESNQKLYDYAIDYIESDRKLLPVIVRGSSTSLSSSFLNALQLTLNDDGLSNVMPETHFQAAINTINAWKSDFKKTYEEFRKHLGKPIDQFVLLLKEYDIDAYERFIELYPRLTSGSTFNPFLGFDVVELFDEVSRKVKSKGYAGIYVVYDEFSKYLESSIATATISDIKLLQDFAEKCCRSGNAQMHLLLICHKDIANYIDGGLPKDKVDGWRGVSGRFKHIDLHNNYAQMYEIISTVIKKDKSFWTKFQKDNRNLFSELSERFTKNGLIDGNVGGEIHDAIFGCFPLQPVTTFILPRLSERVAQNERTMFTFLSSNEKHTLSMHLKEEQESALLVTPDYLYDYFAPLLRKEPYTSEAYKLYKLTSTVLQKVKDESLEAKIIKTIALIYLVEQFEKLPPVVDVIFDAFRDVVNDPKVISDALISLINKECIVYLKRSNGHLRIKESSGVDIAEEIKLHTEKHIVSLKPSDILNEATFDNYMYPTSYNEQNEITRYFDFLFITVDELLGITDYSKKLFESGADGIVYAIIAQSEDELKMLEKAVKRPNVFPERMVVITPTDYAKTDKVFFEYQAVKSLRLTVADDDVVLADEYDIYIDDLSEVIGAFINNYTKPEKGKARYYYKGRQEPIHRKSQLSGLLSDICSEVFRKTPIINNEVINKSIITSQTQNSRTKILAGLLENDLKPNLGLVGTGQEVSIMRSTLVQTGVVSSLNENPKVDIDPTDKKMAYLLSVIQSFFADTLTNGEQSFGMLYSKLMSPAYGIGLKRGVIPIYIATILHLNKQNLIIRCKNREERITPDLLNDINNSPNEYFVILEGWDEDKTSYLSVLDKVFEQYIVERERIYNGFAYIVFAMNRWYMNLPKYAKELRNVYCGEFEKPLEISSQHTKFVNSLKLPDNNPRDYLFVRLVSIFGTKNPTADLATLIRSVKDERDNAIDSLITCLVDDIKRIFAGGKTGATLSSVIKDWYESLTESTLKRLFAHNENQILNLLSSAGNDERVLLQRLAKAVSGLRIDDWTSETVPTFLNDLRAFKDTVDDYNTQKSVQSNAEYKITFVDDNGAETVRTFEKAEYSDTAELMLGEISRVIDEYNHSITEQEKRQVIMDLLEKYCAGKR